VATSTILKITLGISDQASSMSSGTQDQFCIPEGNTPPGEGTKKEWVRRARPIHLASAKSTRNEGTNQPSATQPLMV